LQQSQLRFKWIISRKCTSVYITGINPFTVIILTEKSLELKIVDFRTTSITSIKDNFEDFNS